MGECEVCGAMKVGTKPIMMGKAQVHACTRCVEKLGLAPKEEAPGIKLSRTRTPFTGSKPRRKNDIMAKREKELAEDFGSRITNARKAKGWTHAELGKRIAETVNVIKSAESGKPPTDSLIKKLERVLGIVLLVESTPSETSRVVHQGSRNMTLGDYFKQNGA